MADTEIEIEINGQKLSAKPNQTVIQVADEAGIYIPRFCYHQHLSIPANCRMCLVEVEKMPKVVPACATPVMPGMKVFTKSQKTLLAQRAVMEFLLINHPLDCPICDQGGECELQDLSMGYGASQSRYKESKRAVADQNLGPLIATEMTRCIYCTRCVRFGDEIAGIRELGAIGRGEFTEISTYIQHAMQSEVSGNVIDLCPVGALTSKPFRFTARAWELDQAESIGPHDCAGANLHVHTRYGVVMRVVPRENQQINQTWIADRDRFSYTGLYHAERLNEPLARIDGRLQPISWEKALELTAAALQETLANQGSDALAGLVSPSSTVEECFLLQKLIKSLGGSHVEHRLHHIDPQIYPAMDIPIAQLADCDGILLIGSNVQKEQPSIGLHIRKAALRGAAIASIHSRDYPFNFKLSDKRIIAPHLIPAALKEYLEQIKKNETVFNGKQKVAILLGATALHHPEASLIRGMAEEIADQLKATLGFLTTGANALGATLAGAISADGLFAKSRKAYILLNVEPEHDCVNPTLACAAMKEADFVVALSPYRCASLEEHADIMLPTTPFTETSGTFVNVSGVWQSFKGVAKPYELSRPAWKILRVLGNFLQLDGFDYESSEQVRDEVKKELPSTTKHAATNNKMTLAPNQLMRLGEIPMYAVDSLVRHAAPLQEISVQDLSVRLHPDTAKKFGLTEKEVVHVIQQLATTQLPVVIDASIASDTACISTTTKLGDSIGIVEIRKVD